MRSRFYTSLSILIVLCISCVNTDDFELPETESLIDDFNGTTTSISAVKGHYNIETKEIYTFQETDVFMEGYVISSDEGGNFYKKLMLQDKPENPTSGIQILVDDASLFNSYEFGRKLYIKLDGLSLWKNNGVMQLGIQNRGDVVVIPKALIEEHLIKSIKREIITPISLTLSEFSLVYANLYVQVEDVQFNKNLVRDAHIFSLAGESTDRYDAERQLESCIDGFTTMLSTSTYSDFKSMLLPKGSGSITGVLSRNFYDDHFVLILNSPKDLDFSSDNRCDPEFFTCGNEKEMGVELLFEENFNSITNENMLDRKGWTNININGGKRFEDATLLGNRFLRVSAYNTMESPMEVWLVTPNINLDKSIAEVLTFEIKASFDNATILSVYITDDFTGNPRTTNWKLLDAQVPKGPSNQNGLIFKKSEFDISCFNGDVNIAFKYLGSAPDKTTTYDIDNVRVTGN
ncbi:DUF5689 domain-containing protein [Gillisia sp. Hel_I_29]|uniref:DUF5689 domain-containing protein n=1 Tax=Gillisia sp. Hel_I_29 TaxID=1249975 RepID=UPI0005562694|nr:DUF5689 domain-containing protein [Gillisia sp. Hel_I_29]